MTTQEVQEKYFTVTLKDRGVPPEKVAETLGIWQDLCGYVAKILGVKARFETRVHNGYTTLLVFLTGDERTIQQAIKLSGVAIKAVEEDDILQA
jgi:hypothetical protein